jgi:hypothetical protein
MSRSCCQPRRKNIILTSDHIRGQDGAAGGNAVNKGYQYDYTLQFLVEKLEKILQVEEMKGQRVLSSANRPESLIFTWSQVNPNDIICCLFVPK